MSVSKNIHICINILTMLTFISIITVTIAEYDLFNEFNQVMKAIVPKIIIIIMSRIIDKTVVINTYNINNSSVSYLILRLSFIPVISLLLFCFSFINIYSFFCIKPFSIKLLCKCLSDFLLVSVVFLIVSVCVMCMFLINYQKNKKILTIISLLFFTLTDTCFLFLLKNMFSDRNISFNDFFVNCINIIKSKSDFSLYFKFNGLNSMTLINAFYDMKSILIVYVFAFIMIILTGLIYGYFFSVIDSFYKIRYSSKGYCIECGQQRDAAKLLTVDIDDIRNHDDANAVNIYRIMKHHINAKGLSMIVQKNSINAYECDANVYTNIENRTAWCCRTCGMTIYMPFMYRKKPSHLYNVKLIGIRNTAKTCLCATLKKRYGDIMIKGTAEYEYFDRMEKNLTKFEAPEPTPASMISSPVLLIKYRNKYIAITDIAGENYDRAAHSVKNDDVVALMINPSREETMRDLTDNVIPAINADISEIVICITKIDKYDYEECMKSHNNIKRTNAFLNRMNGNQEFETLYNACKSKNCPVYIVGHAALGTGVDNDNKLMGNYDPKYIEETLDTFIESGV